MPHQIYDQCCWVLDRLGFIYPVQPLVTVKVTCAYDVSGASGRVAQCCETKVVGIPGEVLT